MLCVYLAAKPGSCGRGTHFFFFLNFSQKDAAAEQGVPFDARASQLEGEEAADHASRDAGARIRCGLSIGWPEESEPEERQCDAETWQQRGR